MKGVFASLNEKKGNFKLNFWQITGLIIGLSVLLMLIPSEGWIEIGLKRFEPKELRYLSENYYVKWILKNEELHIPFQSADYKKEYDALSMTIKSILNGIIIMSFGSWLYRTRCTSHKVDASVVIVIIEIVTVLLAGHIFLTFVKVSEPEYYMVVDSEQLMEQQKDNDGKVIVEVYRKPSINDYWYNGVIKEDDHYKEVESNEIVRTLLRNFDRIVLNSNMLLMALASILVPVRGYQSLHNSEKHNDEINELNKRISNLSDSLSKYMEKTLAKQELKEMEDRLQSETEALFKSKLKSKVKSVVEKEMEFYKQEMETKKN